MRVWIQDPNGREETGENMQLINLLISQLSFYCSQHDGLSSTN